jgi:hypothetical protein
MRAINRLLCAGAFLSFSLLNAQNLVDQQDIPSGVKDKFNKEHPGVPATWTKDGENLKVNYVDPDSNKGQVLVYDHNGSVLRRESELDNATYPPKINDYFISHYPGEKFKTWASEDPAGVKTFFIDRKSEIIWFDREGNPAAANSAPTPPPAPKKVDKRKIRQSNDLPAH